MLPLERSEVGNNKWYQSTLLWGSLSLAITIVCTVVATMTKDIRWLLFAAWPFGCIAVWELLGYFIKQLPKRFWIALPLSLALLAGTWWLYVSLRPDVDDAISTSRVFKVIYADYAKRLGKKKSSIRPIDNSRYIHEHAVVLWMGERSTDDIDKLRRYVYVLWNSGKFERREYVRNPPSLCSNLHYDQKLEQMPEFKNRPPGLEPPYGGIAQLWIENPEQWKPIGYREPWLCFGSSVYYQQFENGIVVGPFTWQEREPQGVYFLLFDNGSMDEVKEVTSQAGEWVQVLKGTASACANPHAQVLATCN